MAKGQTRGNREARKPKAIKKPAPVPVSPFTQQAAKRPLPGKNKG